MWHLAFRGQAPAASGPSLARTLGRLETHVVSATTPNRPAVEVLPVGFRTDTRACGCTSLRSLPFDSHCRTRLSQIRRLLVCDYAGLPWCGCFRAFGGDVDTFTDVARLVKDQR